ncbi:paraquat-inducible membrane protein A [Aliidongia dinghuensis]|uniref:Paraquat-inducible membrane protein A n=1 Tax=Aliidongia dinghuensis TaxID=1867774 RepID=A0A8J2YVE0_9PROT|nr:paraquat-inducible protein A [Aliidongia dinghuensis]GGF27873.1 paraquat-inducible membrane protein A [Aliidongia dinghuensis]
MNPAPAERMGRIYCPDCGLAQTLPPLPAHSVAECGRCGAVLLRRIPGGAGAALALALAAALLLLPANLEPLMVVRFEGAERYNLTATGAWALWNDGYPGLGTLVGLFSVAAPILWLAALLPSLTLVLRGRRLSDGTRSWLGWLFRQSLRLRPWAMTEVYLLGSVVAYTRVRDVAQVEIGFGGWAFLAFALTVLAVDAVLDPRAVWRAIGPGSVAGSETGDVIDCHGCGLMAPLTVEGARCPRCGTALHWRRPDAFNRTAALTAAAFFLYILTNILPILSIVRFGRDEPSTIFAGVRELIQLGLWPLAAIVFVASIAVPLIKLSGLTWFLLAIRRGFTRQVMLRTRLYRFIEGIGRWSNIDVFMISILTALVQFGSLTRVEAKPGAVAFAAVVVLTMLASRSFDARLMWDVVEGSDE